mmetsp:Transcript_24523/g.61734  ORF Transcript_24523/g.61734 Transcript_24523/m.61734 type:complete len:366 (+) Transcript_24523:266-1363(+)
MYGAAVTIDRDSLQHMADEKLDNAQDFFNMRSTKNTNIRFDHSVLGSLCSEVYNAAFLPVLLQMLCVLLLGTSMIRSGASPVLTAVAWILAVVVVLAGVLLPLKTLREAKTLNLRKVKAVHWKPLTFVYFHVVIMVVTGIGSLVFADYLFTEFVEPYQKYLDKKWIDRAIDPLLQSSLKYQDAGVVSFSPDTYIDRAHNGCYRAAGVSYCVVPIVQDTAGTGDRTRLPSSPTGSYDFFAVGKDCCSCPGAGDFQCGDWSFAEAMGGLRQLEVEDRAFYELAVEQWEAAWKKDASNPMFFHWKNRPVEKMQNMRTAFSITFASVVLTELAVLIFLALLQNQVRSMYYEAKQVEWLEEAAAATDAGK